MKKKPTVIKSFDQLSEVLGDEIKWRPTTPHAYDGSTIITYHEDPADWRGVKNPAETKRVSLLAKQKGRY